MGAECPEHSSVETSPLEHSTLESGSVPRGKHPTSLPFPRLQPPTDPAPCSVQLFQFGVEWSRQEPKKCTVCILVPLWASQLFQTEPRDMRLVERGTQVPSDHPSKARIIEPGTVLKKLPKYKIMVLGRCSFPWFLFFWSFFHS